MTMDINRWDPSEVLETSEDIIEYLNAVLEESDDIAVFQAALGDVARAQGMTEIARQAGVGRESLYKALRQDSQPSLQTVSKVVSALGGRFAIKRAS
ncbi:MAG: addiction module antidote protein [Ancrocorticia sp.]